MFISSDTIVCCQNGEAENGIVNGMMDHEGRPAKRSQSGYWRSACYIIGAGATERFAYYGISSNLITYLTGPLGQSTAAAAASINIWTGTGLLLPLLGAFVAESFLGRYRTIVLSSMLYILALGLLTTSAFLDFRPNELDVLLFFGSLYLMALGQGAYKPCILAFGADQFDDNHPQELRSRSSFFNWWYFSSCAGPLAALLVLNYIQDNISWAIGFGIPCISAAIALSIFLLGTKSYRYRIKRDEKCAISRVAQVFIKAAMNWRVIPSTSNNNNNEEQDTVPHLRSQQFKFLNKALLAPDGSVEYGEVGIIMQEVEEAKALINLIPLWASSLGFGIVLSQPSTLFTKQGITMDRSIGSSFDVPAASLQYIIGLTIIIFVPIYDRVFVPLGRIATGNPSGVTQLQRIGTGMLLCTVSMVIAALVERKRLKTASQYGLAELGGAEVPMSFWWLIPQYIIFGISDVFTIIGLQELFYEEVPCGLKTVALSIYLSILGIGNFLSSFLIFIIQRVTSDQGGQGGWFSDNANGAHLDYFYWLLAGVNAAGLLAFLCFARSFKYTNRWNLVSD
ncbi:PREDICTED: protein NRT1/ PTR FAMILY 5.10-like [Erythranthe guttata]|nr:PREDICTED: protein NRT1/ PTR FAMILY 5.10-like [Erythranthe guttata]|eukprot:XP_012849570.1 PREDICTED: protein NRT1/ PTR FAMILY 5.10-like [Erythranthe guttata]